MHVKEELKKKLTEIVAELGQSDVEVQVAEPSDESHGDYATNLALMLSKKLGKNPREVAEEIVQKLGSRIKDLGFDKTEVAGPGFINFHRSQESLIRDLQQVLNGKRDIAATGQTSKVMVEFADPNPFKEFHIGHLRNISLGEAFCRLLEAQGNEVWRVNYQGDVGMHVAKALYGVGVLQEEMPADNASVDQKAKFLGKAYAAGSKAYEEDEQAKAEIIEINKKVYRQDPAVLELWHKGREWSLEHFEEIYKRVGTVYKRYYFESEVAPLGRELVLSHIDDGVFERHDGAVVFRGEKVGLHTRVFVTKEDYATYEGKDLALPALKYQDFPYDTSVILTAHEQVPYFQVMLAALKEINPGLAAKTQHMSFGFVSLKDGKMSSRTGNVIAGEWLLDEAKRRIAESYKEMDEKTLEQVAVGAVKYSMLKFATASDISFSFDESISLEGNSGPYLQYTYARTQSVLRKAGLADGDDFRQELSSQKGLESEEFSLLRTLSKFDDKVVESSTNFSPNILCNFLFDLAQKYNLFYQKHAILKSDSEQMRLALTKTTGIVVKNGLQLLGIETPEKM